MTQPTTAALRFERDPSTEFNVLAIVGFVLAFFLTVPAIVLGFVALVQIRKTGERGQGLAVAAVVLGFVFSFISFAILVAIAIPVFLGANNAAQDATTESDLANAKVAMLTYASENNGVDPADIDALEGVGFTPSAGTTDLRIVGGGAGGVFCIEGRSQAGHEYHVTQSAGVESGPCGL